MGLLDPTTHLTKTVRTTIFGTKIAVMWCGREFEWDHTEAKSWSPGWVASCGKCSRKSGLKWK